jgi:hypothetical protein
MPGPWGRIGQQILLAASLLLSAFGHGQESKAAFYRLLVTVTDQNHLPVASARVLLEDPSAKLPFLRCETDFAGSCNFWEVPPRVYQLRIQKEGFYELTLPRIEAGRTEAVEAVLSHLQEMREVVNVVESPPAIDPTESASREKLGAPDIINIPYPATRDYRNVLNFIPGVVQDTFGQPHISGAQTYQTLTTLDGFNVSQPANGLLLVRVSTDALQAINVEESRYSAEQGKASGGVLGLVTRMGDDRYRFTATNFIPSLQDKKGITLDKADPRFTVSGPLQKGRLWFLDAIDGEYDNNVIVELPDGADRGAYWRVGNLARIQSNLTQANILNASFLFNKSRDEHAGLSPLNPVEATPDVDQSAYVANIKDQHTFRSGALLEAGFGYVRYGAQEIPLGLNQYFITPETTGGNFYRRSHTEAEREQALVNLYLPPKQWHGRHDLKAGLDLDRATYHAGFQRRSISFLREGQILPPGETCLTLTPSPCSRYSAFPGTPNFEKHNVEVSGYLQDRWFPMSRMLIEGGMRFDWDEIVRSPLLSPRLATTFVLDAECNTKLSAGIGLVYDATNLVLVSRPLAGERTDVFFDASGNPSGSLTTTFSANLRTLHAPRFLHWSIGLERKLPQVIYLRAEFLQRRGTSGFVYNLPDTTSSSAVFVLQNTRQDKYDAFQVTARRTLTQGHVLLVSYTHSRARSSQVLDFNVDNPVFSAQAGGPYPWDAPNRMLSWGLLPFIKKFDVGYSVEWRDGFPFNVVNNQQQLAEAPGSRRFPTFFALNLHLEKRFHLRGYQLAVRGGFDNITDRKNPAVVNNNIDSPQFLTFSAFDRRTFTGRIRFLGRK